MPAPTPHIGASKGDIAKTVIMPGDPLRAKFIAETFLKDPRLVNNIRNIQGYTGTYQGVPVTAMASGMGIPSIGIYSYELFNFYEVDNIIRVGTAGGISDKVKLRDVVAGIGACTNSAFADQYNLPGRFAPTASYRLLKLADEIAARLGIGLAVGSLLSSDNFYNDDAAATEKWAKMGVLAVEMEAAGLYATAARAGKNALALCTISDMIFTGEECSPEERQTTFTAMMEIALGIAVEMDRSLA